MAAFTGAPDTAAVVGSDAVTVVAGASVSGDRGLGASERAAAFATSLAGASERAGSPGVAWFDRTTAAPSEVANTATSTPEAIAVRLPHLRQSLCMYVSERRLLDQSIAAVRAGATRLAAGRASSAGATGAGSVNTGVNALGRREAGARSFSTQWLICFSKLSSSSNAGAVATA